MYKRYALWLLSKGNREKASDYLKSAIALEPDKTRAYLTLLVLYGWNDSEIRAVLPALPGPRLLFADYLSKTGNKVLAAGEYRSAIGFVQNEKEAKASYFYQAYRYFMKTGMLDDALSVMRRAEELLPGDVGIKMALAEAYEKAGIPYRAAEEYRKVLVIDPGNREAKRKIAESE